jgi:hypothetical protein
MMTKKINGIILRRIVLNNSGAARAYGCLSTSFSRLERDTRRRGAFSLYRDSNAFPLYSHSQPVDAVSSPIPSIPQSFQFFTAEYHLTKI